MLFQLNAQWVSIMNRIKMYQDNEIATYQKFLRDLENDLKNIRYDIKRLKEKMEKLKEEEAITEVALMKCRALIDKLKNKSNKS
jgi:peptidoglycan hydrolase CwlO-like protein